MNLEDLNIGIVVQLKNLKTTEKEVETFTEKVKESTDRINDTKTNQSIGNWNKNFKKLNKTLGIFIGSLFTVRGIWFALRKAMTSYLSQNDELKSKLDGLYYAVGSMFAPLLEYMVNGLIKIVSYIDILAKSMGLAGMNMANFNKTATKVKKTLLGIDEINNLSSNEGSSAINPFENVKLNQKWVDFMSNLGEKLKPIVDYLKNASFEDIIWDIGLLVAAYEGLKTAIELVTGSMREKNNILGRQNKLEGDGTNIVNNYLLQYGLLGSMVYYVANAYGKLADKFKEWKDIFGREGNGQEENEWSKRLGALAGGLVVAFAIMKTALDNINTNITEWLNTTVGNIANWATTTADNVVMAVSSWATTVYEGAKNIADNVASWCKVSATNIGNWVVNTATNIGNWAKNVAESVGNSLSSAWESFKSFMSATGQAISSWWSGMWNVTVPAITIGTLGITYGLFKKFAPGGMSVVPAYANGTNYVPNDQLAMIHKGEAVVPKKFNSSEFFGETSAEELNLLSAINEQLIELNNKNYTINLDGENVAKKIDNSLQQLKQRQGVRVFEVAR